MAATTTPPSIELPAALPLSSAGRRLAVACSGGRDSMALLHAAVREGSSLGAAVVALHVHHGLSAQADTWLDHVREQCARWAFEGLPVSFQSRRLALSPGGGESVEALARGARYQALAQMCQEAGCDAVLLAHHRRDQAETFVLQALRGAGVAGLACMAGAMQRHGVTWLRPWLGQPRERIEAYVALHAVPFVDDDSNTDHRFARNRLRLAVWPALQQAFGDAEQALAQAAAHQSDVLACMDDWLAIRLPEVSRAVAAGQGDEAGATRLALDVQAWSAWAEGPRRELLRGWFRQATGRVLPASWVQRLHSETLGAVARRWPLSLQALASNQPVLEGEVVLYRGLLTWKPRTTVASVFSPGSDQVDALNLHIEAAGCVLLPAGWGELVVEPVAAQGVPLSWLNDCALAPRRGGERFQMAAGRPARSLKKQFQMLAVPAWAREGPLLWAQGQLIFVPGLGMDARAWGRPGETQVRLTWRPAITPDPSEHAGIPPVGRAVAG